MQWGVGFQTRNPSTQPSTSDTGKANENSEEHQNSTVEPIQGEKIEVGECAHRCVPPLHPGSDIPKKKSEMRMKT